MQNLMNEEFILNVDELTMCDPCDNLIQKHLLAFFEDDMGPAFEPGIAFLEGLPKHIDDDSSFVLLRNYFLNDGP